MSDHTELMKQCEAELKNIGVAQRGGKKYMMVKDRMTFFRQAYGLEYGVITQRLHSDEKSVCVQAQIIDPGGRIVGSGLAEEQRGSGVNKASALENCESSAIGRALASLGLHGGEYPTADEIESDKRSSEIIDGRKKEWVPEHRPKSAADIDVTGPGIVSDEIPFDKKEERVDWESWVNKAIAGMTKHKHTAEHMNWSKANQQYLKRLEKDNADLHQELLDAYLQTKSELENKR